MSETRTDVLNESRKKGIVAGAVTAASVTAAVAGAPFIATIAAVPAAVLAYRWWRHRAENGIKF